MSKNEAKGVLRPLEHFRKHLVYYSMMSMPQFFEQSLFVFALF